MWLRIIAWRRLGVDQGGDGLAGLDGTVGDKADVDDLAARHLLHRGDPDLALFTPDNAGVGDLAARFGVEGGLVQDNQDLVPFGREFSGLAADQEPFHLRGAGEGLIAGEDALPFRQLQLLTVPGRAALGEVVLAGTGFLFLHISFETFDVDGKTIFGDQCPGSGRPGIRRCHKV